LAVASAIWLRHALSSHKKRMFRWMCSRPMKTSRL
jgi:hypothetical protein